MRGRNSPLPPVIKHPQHGCVSVQRDPDGRIYRRRLHSLAFKGEDAHGVEATWVVTAPVAGSRRPRSHRGRSSRPQERTTAMARWTQGSYDQHLSLVRFPSEEIAAYARQGSTNLKRERARLLGQRGLR